MILLVELRAKRRYFCQLILDAVCGPTYLGLQTDEFTAVCACRANGSRPVFVSPKVFDNLTLPTIISFPAAESDEGAANSIG